MLAASTVHKHVDFTVRSTSFMAALAVYVIGQATYIFILWFLLLLLFFPRLISAVGE